MGKNMQIRCVGFASVSIVTVRFGRDSAPVSLLGSVTCGKSVRSYDGPVAPYCVS